MRTNSKVKINFIRHGKTPLNEKHCYLGTTDESLSRTGIAEVEALKARSLHKYKNNITEYSQNSLHNPEEEPEMPNLHGLYKAASLVRGLHKTNNMVFVSPKKRAKETAQILFEDARLIEIKEFTEMDFGSFEGKNYDELKDNPCYRMWIDISRGEGADELVAVYGDLYKAYLREDKNFPVIMPEDKETFTNRCADGIKTAIRLYEEGLQDENKAHIENDITIVAHGGTIMSILSTYSDGDYYEYMIKNAEGIETEAEYTYNDGVVEISRISITGRIHP